MRASKAVRRIREEYWFGQLDQISDYVNLARSSTKGLVLSSSPYPVVAQPPEEDILQVLTQDPASPAEGEQWIRSDLEPKEVRTRLGGITYRRHLTVAPGYAPTESPFVNLMPDSGRFAGKMDPLSRSAPDAPFSSGFLNPYNGATLKSAGKFVHDNTTHGGPAGNDLTQSVQDLLVALGRSGASARYGVEFHVVEYTMGSGVAPSTVGPDGVTRYEMSVNGNRAIFGFKAFSTFACWMRLKSAGTVESDALQVNLLTKKDGVGVEVAADELVTVADGWTHILLQVPNPLGYITTFPYIRCRVGDVVEIALPAFFAGPVDPGIHKAPLPTVNELIDGGGVALALPDPPPSSGGLVYRAFTDAGRTYTASTTAWRGYSLEAIVDVFVTGISELAGSPSDYTVRLIPAGNVRGGIPDDLREGATSSASETPFTSEMFIPAGRRVEYYVRTDLRDTSSPADPAASNHFTYEGSVYDESAAPTTPGSASSVPAVLLHYRV